MQTIRELVDKNATLENAIQWNKETDKFVFCIDIDGISANWQHVDYYVEILEMRFITLLCEHDIELNTELF